MTNKVPDANPLKHPLHGLSLIESSAGTGKTTLLVRLYLRALLREGFTLDRILAVTYTRAATGELSVRIRKGLLDAAKNLQQPEEPFWKDFFRRVDRDEVKKRIEAALAAFDDKGVFTIHGFCQRMLADNAFEASTAFASEEVEDEDALRAEVAADFWRRRVGTRPPPYVQWFVETFKSPANLLDKKLRKALQVSGCLIVEPTVEDADIKTAICAFKRAAKSARDAWGKCGGEVRDILLNAKENGLNASTYNDAAVETLLTKWSQWLAVFPALALPGKFDLMTASKLEEKTKKGKTTPSAPFFDVAERLSGATKRLADLWWQETVAAAFKCIREELRRRKRAQRVRGFDDILQELRCALCHDKTGTALAQRIAKQYPLILVDEFQDTDPLQYDIFKAIHEAGGDEHGLVLIGDPKQAIYRFRGADIATYLKARGECDRMYVLTKNYRSAPQLLAAVNPLFAERQAFEYESMKYKCVTTGCEPPLSPLKLDGASDAPTTVVCAGGQREILNKDDARRRAARVCAAEIARLIRLGAQGKARIDAEPVKPGDIAVLVGTNKHGSAVQEALRELHIPAAMVATQNVFASEESRELESLLAAVAEPTDGRLLRRAHATRLLGATAQELTEWMHNEDAWAAKVERFRDYYREWQERGVTIMLARLLREERVIERTLARLDDGERAMTNLRHLVELVGAEAARRPGIAPLLAWFAAERVEEANEETRQLRLESDEGLVRIATIHKAKGLQYPVVFLPFLWDGGSPRESNPPAVLAHRADGEAVLDLGSPELAVRRDEAAKDTRAEDARKTYVALTRAVRACYIVAMPAKGCEKSAFGRLLGIQEPDEFFAGLDVWKKAAQGTVGVRAPALADDTEAVVSPRRYGEAGHFDHTERLQRRFHVASYSMLASGADGTAAEEPEHDEAVVATPSVEKATGIHAFPAGATSGTFLHELIEKLPFASDRETIAKVARQELADHGFDADRWTGDIADWLLAAFATPLGAPGCCLADIGDKQRVNEMEFRFVLNRIEAAGLDEAVAGFAPEGRGPRLDFKVVAGQMKGYLDLVFEHGGRYWVVDYKSNRLGADVAAYTPAALDLAMAEHRYDLQYLIYTVALNRYLETRVPGYDYEKHFGGVLYLFLRGMAPDAPEPRGVWRTRPSFADLQRLDAYLAGEKQWP